MQLSAELASLQQQYQQLADAYQQGHITVEDAQAALANLTVVDGAGASWSIDIDGQFQRAQGPGLPAYPADASTWVAADPNAGTAGAPGFGGQPDPMTNLATPPTVPTPSPVSPAMPGIPGAPGSGGSGDLPGFEAPKSLGGSPLGASLSADTEPEAKSSSGSVMTSAVKWVSEHKVTAGLGVFGVGLIGFALLQFMGSGSETDSQFPPVNVDAPSVSVDDPVDLPLDSDAGSGVNEPREQDPEQDVAEEENTGIEVVEVATLPGEQDVQQALNAFSVSAADGATFVIKTDSNEITAAHVVIAGAGSSPDVSVQTTSPEKAKKENRATQAILVTNSATGDTVMRANVTWEQTPEGQWLLVRAPRFE